MPCYFPAFDVINSSHFVSYTFVYICIGQKLICTVSQTATDATMADNGLQCTNLLLKHNLQYLPIIFFCRPMHSNKPTNNQLFFIF